MPSFKYERQPMMQESHRDRRIRKADRVARTPVVPAVAKFAYRCMLLLTPVAVALELLIYLNYGFELGARHLLGNIAASAFATWTFFAALLLAVCALQLGRLRRGYVETAYHRREVGDDEENSLVPVRNPEEKYRGYSRVAAGGVLVTGVVYWLVSMLV